MMPCWCATVATLRISTKERVGLEGDSIQISFVSLGRINSTIDSSMLGENVT